MNSDILVSEYPRVYHMAEVGSWESISGRGLLSTTALLDLYEISGEERTRLESSRRDECEYLLDNELGSATIRDNKPMTDNALRRSLQDGLEPKDWYEILNRRCFFWVKQERLMGLLNARAYRDREHIVLTVDTESLVEAHYDNITLCPYNSGSTAPANPARGLDTFKSIDDYDWKHHKSRNSRDPIVELTIGYSVPDIAVHALRVESMHGNKVLKTIWKR